METKTCPACRQEKPLGEFYKSKKRVHSWCKRCLCESHNRRWVERKIEAIRLFGGKCCECGYCKNYAALEFHHLDPKEKDFVWAILRRMEWPRIIEELKKCILLCANCHRETHWPSASVDQYGEATIKTLLNRTNEIKPTGSCPNCGKDVYGTNHCSVACSSFSRRKAQRPSRKKLEQLLNEKPTTQIALYYGVSDNAVKKWAKSYGIWRPRRDSNPE